MNTCFHTFYGLAKEQLKYSPARDPDSILESFWQEYRVGHIAGTEEIERHFQETEGCLTSLSQKRRRIFLRTVTDLCLEHERVAFIEGLQIGSQLACELFDFKSE